VAIGYSNGLVALVDGAPRQGLRAVAGGSAAMAHTGHVVPVIDMRFGGPEGTWLYSASGKGEGSIIIWDLKAASGLHKFEVLMFPWRMAEHLKVKAGAAMGSGCGFEGLTALRPSSRWVVAGNELGEIFVMDFLHRGKSAQGCYSFKVMVSCDFLPLELLDLGDADSGDGSEVSSSF